MSRMDPMDSALPPTLGDRVDSACDRFEEDWRAGQRPAIEDHLGGLSGREREVMLRELLRIELAYRSRFGERIDSADYRARFPSDAAVLGELIHDPDETAASDIPSDGQTLLLAGLSVEAIALQPDDRFRVLRPHARGGLGEVLLAVDTQLNRHVALKRILRHHADNPEARRRFVLEAEVTGGLEHPGIVPVYGLGASPDGQPHYAMRFVRGESLRQAIKEFHRLDSQGGRDPVERSLALRGLLGRFVAACNAVAYAHSRGVIHRDLKPDNILLGPYGEVLLVDWGLAKVMGATEPSSEGEGPLHPLADADGATRTGMLLGTPAYMSPEQADGQGGRIGPASDVYGLGATLYAILSGRSPGGEGNVETVLMRVRAGSFPTPRQANPSVPPALDAICRKAMAREPVARYADPRALASDIERWLADEPVGVYREPILTRASRWLRRHRTAATASAAAVVAALAVLGVAYRREAGINARLDAANRDLTTAKAEADRRLDQTLTAIEDYYTGVGEEVLLGQQEFAPLRRRLLEKPREFYERMAKELADGSSGDARSRYLLAGGRLGLGHIASVLGREDEAREQCTAAIKLCEQLAADYPDDPMYRERLAKGHTDLAFTYRNGSNLPEMAASLKRAVPLLENLVKGDPASERYRDLLSITLNNLSYTQRLRGNLPAAIEAIEQAITYRAELTAAKPENESGRRLLAIAYYNLGILRKTRGNLKGAIESYHRAIDILEPLATEHPDVIDYLVELATTHTNLGNVLSQLGDLPGTVASQRKAAEMLDQATAARPNNIDYQGRLAAVLMNLGNATSELGDHQSAAESQRRAIAIRERLAAANPGTSNHAAGLGNSYSALGGVLRKAGDFQEAAKAYRRAVAIRSGLAEAQSDVPTYRDKLAASLSDLGITLKEIGDIDGAIAELRRAIALSEEVVSEQPDVPAFREGLAQGYGNLGAALHEQGDIQGALASHRRAVSLFDELTKAHPDDFDYRMWLADSLFNLGDTALTLRQPEEAAAALKRSISIHPEHSEHSAKDADLARANARLGEALDGLEDEAGAEAARRKAIEILADLAKAGEIDEGDLKDDPVFGSLINRSDFREVMRRIRDRAIPTTLPEG